MGSWPSENSRPVAGQPGLKRLSRDWVPTLIWDQPCETKRDRRDSGNLDRALKRVFGYRDFYYHGHVSNRRGESSSNDDDDNARSCKPCINGILWSDSRQTVCAVCPPIQVVRWTYSLLSGL